MRINARIFFLAALLLFFPSYFLTAQNQEELFKEQVNQKFQQAVSLAQELNLYQQDVSATFSKIQRANQAMLDGNYEEAEEILDKVDIELKQMRAKASSDFPERLRFYWLEIYFDIIQKYILLALLAYLFVSRNSFRQILKTGQSTFFQKILLSILIVSFALLLSSYDWMRYKVSSWTFFDFQVVMLGIGGILTGVWFGLLMGIVLAVIRYNLYPAILIYALIPIFVGAISGLLSRGIDHFQSASKKIFGIGCVLGIIQGIIVYFPMASVMPWPYLAVSILFLALLEGTGIWIFFAITASVLRGEAKKELESELLKTKLLFLQAQIKPHFLFNILDTIASICGREKESRAEKLLVELARFLRMSLKPEEDKVTLREEIDYIDSYVDLEQARFENRLKVEKDFKLSEKLWQTKIPLLILQPLAENAIKHGILEKEEGGILTLRIREEGKDLLIEMIDNGVGMSVDTLAGIFKRKERAPGHLGIGVRNVHERLMKYYGSEYGLQFESQPGKGTKVSIRIPVEG